MAYRAAFSIASRRLANQHISWPSLTKVAELVTHLGAIQAQDYLGALWAIGLRTIQATEADVEQAIAQREIVRSWPMRGTIHFVAAADLRWMLALLAPRVIRSSQSRLRQLEINTELLSRSADSICRALEDGKQLTRPELYHVLAQEGINAHGSRGLHILGQLSMQGLLCFGPRAGKQPTFVLLDEWLARTPVLTQEEALAELIVRYFSGHGPATVQDCMWWSGLTKAEVKAGLALVGNQLDYEQIEQQDYYFSPHHNMTEIDAQQAFLLPPFDELLLGYRNRKASLAEEHNMLVAPGSNGIFHPIIVINAQVVGLWKRTLQRKAVELEFSPFQGFEDIDRHALDAPAEHYGVFLGLPVSIL